MLIWRLPLLCHVYGNLYNYSHSAVKEYLHQRGYRVMTYARFLEIVGE